MGAHRHHGVLQQGATRLIVIGTVSVLMAMLVVSPLGWVLFNSLHDDATGAWTLGNYTRILGSARLLEPLGNSLLLATSVATLSVVLGVPLAWLVARTNMPARGLVRSLTLTAFVTPSFVGALGWILLGAPNSGWLNLGWRGLSGSGGSLLNIYSMAGTIFVCAIYTVPYTFTIVAGALEEMAVELEHAATTLGSGTIRTMLSITIPLMSPAVMAGFILSFIQGLTLFGVPAFLLTPARILVVTTKLAEFYQLFPPEIFISAAYCIPLLAVTGVLFYLRKRILGRRQFTVITGRAGATHRIDLRGWRWPALGFGAIVPMTAVILPYGAILLVSLSRAWGLGPVPGNLTLHWYSYTIFDNPETATAIVNSVLYAIASATACVLLGTVVAYIVERRLCRGAMVLGWIAMAPIVIPGIVLSIGFFSAYTRPPLNLYGTSAILIAAFVATFLPIAFTNGGAVLKGIGIELENAARILGAGEARTFAQITAPLMRAGLVSSWLLVFIPVIRELSVAVFLITPRTNVMTTLIYNFKDGGNYEAVCAMSVLLLLGTLAVAVVAQRLTARRPSAGRPVGKLEGLP